MEPSHNGTKMHKNPTGARFNIQTVFSGMGIAMLKTVLSLTWVSLYRWDDIFILRQPHGVGSIKLGPISLIRFSIVIQIWWKFRSTLTSILIQWSLQNFVQGMTSVLSWQVQKFVAIWWPAMELQQGDVSIKFELGQKIVSKTGPQVFAQFWHIVTCLLGIASFQCVIAEEKISILNSMKPSDGIWTRHYLNQSWQSSMTLNGVTRPHCVKIIPDIRYHEKGNISYLTKIS